jgi:hypothetical protein
MRPAAAAFVLTLFGAAAALAQEEGAGVASSGGFLEDYFRRVTRAQESQPHWISPLFTTTPRLNERFRYDFSFQARPGDMDLGELRQRQGARAHPRRPRRRDLRDSLVPRPRHAARDALGMGR